MHGRYLSLSLRVPLAAKDSDVTMVLSHRSLSD